MSNFVSREDERLGIFKILLATFIAVAVSLGLILLFAFTIKWFDLSDAIIAPVNIAIKIISIGVGILIVTKDGKQGIKRGAVIGASYIVLSYLIFSILLGSFNLSFANLWDLILGVVSGAILGVISVNIRR